MFQTKVVEKIKTYFMFSDFFLKKSCVYGIMWKNIVDLGRPQMTVWCMHIVCWVLKATDTHLEYVILVTFPWQQWLHMPQCYVLRTLPVLFTGRYDKSFLLLLWHFYYSFQIELM